MKNKIPAIIALISLVAAAGGITVGLKATTAKNAAQREAEALRAKLNATDARATPDREEQAESTPLVALKDIAESGTNDVAELQEQLAAREAELARLRAEMERRNDRGPRQSFQERMAQLKEEDPERYAEMIQQRTERQQQMRYDQASRLAMFTEMDTSNMTEEQLANHTQLMEKLNALWAATGDFDPENPPDWRAIREAVGDFRELGQMMDQERSYMFTQLGAEVGLSGTDSQDFASYVNEIIDATSLRPPRGMRGGGRDGGPPPGGGQ